MDVTTYRWSSNDKNHRFEVTDPSNGKVVAIIQGGGGAEVDGAVRAANAAFHDHWRWRPGRERGALMQEAARRLRLRIDAIAAIEVRENGKPLAAARADVEVCIASFDYFGGLAGKLPGDFFDGGVIYGATLVEPYGVVAAIIPFNWPPIHTGGKIAPALAMGNTIVVKPPEQTPQTVLEIIEILQEVFPADVIQAVPGFGPEAGAALAGHKLVRMISFTGAPKTGAAVVKSSADNHTPALLELGGKNALIVLEDADLDLAAGCILEAGYVNKGEACTAGSRVLVHRSRLDELLAKLTPMVAKLKVGAGTDPATQVGPQITLAQQQKILEYIRIGVEEGAHIAVQGKVPEDPALRGGYFVPPTLFIGVEPNMRIAREEIFGPVVCVLVFDDVAEAISIANDTDFGLTAAVFSRDHSKALSVSRSLDVGLVFINNYYRGIMGMPFGGTKASGYGREHSIETLKEFGRTKLITMVSGLGPIPRWPAPG